MRAPRSSSIVMLDEPALYKACCGMFNLLIGGRMHPAILAAAMGTPVIGLAYNPKFGGAFELLGTPDRWIDMEWFVRNGCVERLNSLIDAAIDGGRLPLEPVASLVRESRTSISNFQAGSRDPSPPPRRLDDPARHGEVVVGLRYADREADVQDAA